ncbi:MAG: CoB--CoM heterodisulfide reductase iron-sulfur subunit A family protein [Nitrospirota bacterium]
MSKTGAVLVVGAGIGGMQAALDLAESGFKVYLLERQPSIGGRMPQLDKTFPTNDCAMCTLAPRLVDIGKHPNIKLITYAELEEVKGDVGNFDVKIKMLPRYVDIEKCVGCGACNEKCPTKKVLDTFNEDVSTRKAIYAMYPQGIPLCYTIDKENCTVLAKGKKCGVCKKVCARDAIDFNQQEKIIELKVGSIILSPGYDKFDAKIRGEYGYGRYKNVVTSLQFERILSSSGPFRGHLQRLSDGEEPKRIAWIQCVGSRDPNKGNAYCSAVCCTYAVKQAIIAKEHIPGKLDATIFYMDMRTFGKGFEEYYNRAKDVYGVRFIRTRVAEVKEIGETKNLILRYEIEDGNKVKEEEFDMVVLSVGLIPKGGTKELAQRLGVGLNEYGFCQTSEFAPVRTNKPGIYVAGVFEAPKDIPETVMQGSAAAGEAASLLAEARGTLVTHKEYPPEIDVTGQEPRIGVFVCHCGINIAGVVDVPQVVEYVKTLPNVIHAENNLYTCSQDTQKLIIEKIKEHNLNRVVVASCTPKTHEPLFRDTTRLGGLNPYLFEMANIRDQCSWVHQKMPEAATQKAKDLIRMAVAKARLLEPLYPKFLEINHEALVIGGGLAGMTTALSLADQGFETHLVEKKSELGGMFRKVKYLSEGDDPSKRLKELIEKVKAHKNIHLYLGTTIDSVKGSVGNFTTTLNGGEKKIDHGVIIVATGASELRPKEYLYGQDGRVMTQLEIEEHLVNPQSQIRNAKSIVMVQCVGSREPDRPYCSRVCCQEAIKNALKIKEINPKTEVYILYRDMRSYGFKEIYYQKAREKGVIFIRYDEDNKPVVSAGDGRLAVQVREPLLDVMLKITPDLIVLSPAIVPNEDNVELSKLLKVPLNQNGFFLEAHMKLRPVDFSTDGIFLAGLCHSPKSIEESIAQAQAASARAGAILSQSHLTAEGIISCVNEALCRGCGLCKETCVFGAIELIERAPGVLISNVKEGLCKGCGACSVVCPTGAMSLRHYTDDEVLVMVESALKSAAAEI